MTHRSVVTLLAGAAMVGGCNLAPGYLRPLLRQLQVTLVLPMLVWDSDQRGGHDIMTRLALRLV